MIDRAVFDKLFPRALEGTYQALLDIAIPKADLTTQNRIRYFLAQCGHESAGFSTLRENLNYTSAGRILAVWPSRFKSKVEAIPYISNPEKLANRVYANRIGNGSELSGDGWKYRGRGWIGLTFKGNYQHFFHWAGMPEDSDPEFVATIKGAAMSSAYFWKENGLNPLCDKRNFVAVTRKINPGMAGIDDRKRILATIEKEAG